MNSMIINVNVINYPVSTNQDYNENNFFILDDLVKFSIAVMKCH